MSIANLPSTERKEIVDAFKEWSGSLTRVAAERDLRKAILEKITNKIDIEPKMFRAMAKVYHDQNFEDTVELNREFEETYMLLTGAKVE
jgi:hypothetical protein